LHFKITNDSGRAGGEYREQSPMQPYNTLRQIGHFMFTGVRIFGLILGVVFLIEPSQANAQQKLVRILVTSPYIEHISYQPIADVVAGTIIRDFKRIGGMEMLDREEAERIIRENGGDGWVATRQQASFIGNKMNADIVVYTTLQKNYDYFHYSISFYQVKTDMIQRSVNGTFINTESASSLSKLVSKETDKFKTFIPSPYELEDPGANIRVVTVDPDNLPREHQIENIPEGSEFGGLERVLSHFRVFPSDTEYYTLAQGTRVIRFNLTQEMDEELTHRYNTYNAYGDFALRHDLQAFFIENCSIRAVNVLVANNIPVFYNDDIITGYQSLGADNYCIFNTISNAYFDTANMSHRDRMVVMFIVPNVGRKGGVSREYLDAAISRFKDEWDETPVLHEITEGTLDLSTSPNQ
jgi:hypothetical protein